MGGIVCDLNISLLKTLNEDKNNFHIASGTVKNIAITFSQKEKNKKTLTKWSTLVGSHCKQFQHSLFYAVLGCHCDALMIICVALIPGSI